MVINMKHSTAAEAAGKRDYEEGLPFNRNPMQYGPNVFSSGLWEKGWKEAERKAEEARKEYEKDIPIIECYLKDGFYYFWCDYCKCEHHHSSEDGHRISHCHNRTAGQYPKGYIIKLSEIEILRKALAFYANKDNYWPKPLSLEENYCTRTLKAKSEADKGNKVLVDWGDIARKALLTSPILSIGKP